MRQPIIPHEALLRILHMPLKLIPEVSYRRRDRPGRRIPQGTDRIAFYLPLDIPQQVDIALLPLPRLDITKDLLHPTRSFPAGAALSAALMAVEPGKSQGILYHALVFVQH